MQAFLDFVVKGLVDRPDAVDISPVDRSGLTVYGLRVHPTDVGKIIGKFDFYEYQLSVTQPGKEPLSYTRHSVTLIRPPKE